MVVVIKVLELNTYPRLASITVPHDVNCKQRVGAIPYLRRAISNENRFSRDGAYISHTPHKYGFNKNPLAYWGD